jgi:hypothetical protein
MTVEELLNELSELPPCAEVRIASQPRWPFEYTLQGVYVVEPGDTDDDEETAPTPDVSSSDEDEASDELPVVYLAEGSQLGYLPKPARDEIGW